MKAMMKGRIVNILLPFLLIQLFSFGFCTRDPHHLVAPLVEKGNIDLSGWEFKKGGNIILEGQWEFYWDQFIKSGVQGQSPVYVEVPSHWQEYQVRKGQPSLNGKASFRLNIKLPKGGTDLYLRIPSSDTTMLVMINGDVVFKNGLLTGEVKNIHPVYYAPINIALPKNQNIEMIVHLANEHYPRPGFRDPFRIGNKLAIRSSSELNLFFEIFLLGSVFFMGLYHTTLFLLRTKDRTPLYFAIFCYLITIRLVVTGEGLIFHLLPVTWHISTFLEYLTFYLAPSSFFAFISSLYPKESNIKINMILYCLTFAFISILVFASISFYTKTLPWFQFSILPFAIYIIYVIVVSIKNKRETARMLLFGIIIFFMTVLNDVLFSLRLIFTYYLTPAGVFIFFFSQSFLLSRRFALAFNTVESLKMSLEDKVKERTQELEVARKLAETEQAKSDKLLLNILPEATATELKLQGEVEPLFYKSTSIMFTDFAGFTTFAATMKPEKLIHELNDVFTQFDEITEKFNVEKIKTIGDSFMAAGGLPVANNTHPFDVCLAALEIMAVIKKTNQMRKETTGSEFWQLRIGIHSGPVMAGVVGKRKFAYDIFGDAVNIASRCESSSVPGKINISEDTYNQVHEYFECEKRGIVELKNRGQMKMYYLKGLHEKYCEDEGRVVPNATFLSLMQDIKRKDTFY